MKQVHTANLTKICFSLQSNKHNKTNDVKTSLQTGKNFKISTEYQDKTVVNNPKRLNATIQVTKDTEKVCIIII